MSNIENSMLSEYMSYEEAVRSQTAERNGIDNTPNPEQVRNMIFVSVEVFDKIRYHFGFPLTCSSFFRCPELNSKIGSTDRSFHTHGAAIDIKKLSQYVTYAEIFDFIRCELEFSELIWEYGTVTEPAWVHVAFLEGDNRKMVKRAYRDLDGKNHVIPFDLY